MGLWGVFNYFEQEQYNAEKTTQDYRDFEAELIPEIQSEVSSEPDQNTLSVLKNTNIPLNDPLSLAKRLGGKATGAIREATVHHSVNGSFSIRQGKWKLVLCAGSGGWSVPKPGKESKEAPPMQLFDMTEDVSERKNLYYEHPEVVKKLTALLQSYIDRGRSTPGASQQESGETDIFRGIPKGKRGEIF